MRCPEPERASFYRFCQDAFRHGAIQEDFEKRAQECPARISYDRRFQLFHQSVDAGLTAFYVAGL
jgi:hypothetical protein